jgi:DNA-binding CsgD family transcriptional regulator
VSDLSPMRAPLPPPKPLTHSEIRVIILVADGASDKDIAQDMRVSVSTAKTYATRARIKVGARNRAHLVAIAMRAGLVQ